MRKQAVRYTATGIVGVLLVLALAVMVNWLGARHWKRFDWTGSHLYTLSQKSLNIVKDLKDDVRVVVFMTPSSKLYEQVHELLGRYASASPKIHVEYIDPDKEPLKTRQLAQQFKISVANTVVFAVGDRTKYVTSDQMADYDYSGMQMGGAPKLKAFKGEEQFTAAILSLVSPHVPKVYFVTGHGEASIAAGARGRSLADLDQAIKREDMQVADTSLLSGSVPKDADVLAIIGPTAPYAENELTVLGKYLDGGGRLLVCLDPLIQRDGHMTSTRLEGFLAQHGVQVDDDLVVDPSRRLPFFDLSAVYLTDFTSHPITDGLQGMAVLFPVTRSLKAVPGKGWTATELVKTTADGWGETNLKQLLAGKPVAKDANDIAGPVAVAVAVQGRGGQPAQGAKAGAEKNDGFRLVAFGDSDFLTDGQISNAGNLTLALNSFNWLAKREQSIGIPPRAVEQVSLFLSSQQLRTILLITLIGMPGLVIIIGVFVWRRRRH
ncbi:MAG: GldG family protein [Acidobacteria bacterium]|nr:GldG family protein [Acidobacteriota bacterium]